MTDDEFIAYCEAHSETERAGFVPENIVRILRLSGNADLAAVWEKASPDMIVRIRADVMHPVCARARERLAQKQAAANFRLSL